jgi:clan AA aspartic protease
MGTFSYPIEIGDPEGERFEPLEALVDTGASYTVVPARHLRNLGITSNERWPFRLADERVVEYDIAQTQVRIDGRLRFTIVIFGDDAAEPLLGAYTLEGFGLAVDPIGQRLIPVPGLLKSFR